MAHIYHLDAYKHTMYTPYHIHPPPPTHHTYILHISPPTSYTPHINKYTFPHTTHPHTTYMYYMHLPICHTYTHHTSVLHLPPTHLTHVTYISSHSPYIHTTTCHRHIHSNMSHVPLHVPHSIHIPHIPPIYPPHTSTHACMHYIYKRTAHMTSNRGSRAAGAPHHTAL